MPIENRGVLKAIRALVAQNIPSGKIIKMGYARGSVMKARRQYHRSLDSRRQQGQTRA